MKTKQQVLDFIKKHNLADGEMVIDCFLYPNGFEFETKKHGLKLCGLDGNDIIGDLAKGEMVLNCYLYPNGFKFKTEKHDWQYFDLDEKKGNTFNHLMLDIETMGNESFSSIVSIGALEFDIETGKTGKEFYTNVDLQSCIDLGLIMNASTVMWWMQQNEQSRKDLTQRTALPIVQALEKFSEFCNKDYQIWGNSARFDCGILQNAYNKAGIALPWHFAEERCVRTLVSFNPQIKYNYPRMGTAHNALSDCYYQVGYCSEIWASLHH